MSAFNSSYGCVTVSARSSHLRTSEKALAYLTLYRIISLTVPNCFLRKAESASVIGRESGFVQAELLEDFQSLAPNIIFLHHFLHARRFRFRRRFALRYPFTSILYVLINLESYSVSCMITFYNFT